MKVLLVCLLALVASQEAFGTNCDKYREEGFPAIRNAKRVATGTIGFDGVLHQPRTSSDAFFRNLMHDRSFLI